jgi:sugar lactone lactonase YvrE
MARVRLLLCGVLLVLGTLAWSQGTYRNNRIFVVPRPGPVVIDGALTDWDLSGEIFSYVSEPTKDAMNAYSAMMYDSEAIYISARIADETPLKNRWDPAVNPDFGWDGDSFQLRLSLDAKLGYPINIGWGLGDVKTDALVHMTMWYYTDAKQPVLHCKYGMNYHDAPDYPKGIVPGDRFQAAYKAWADGKGYTLEYRIPWATLRAPRAYKAGDLAGSALQVQWSNADGTHLGPGNVVDLQRTVGFSYQHTGCWGKVIFTETGHLPASMTQPITDAPVVRKLPLKFPFTMPRDEVVSVALYNAQGDLVRHVIPAQPRKAGKLEEAWDGLDDAGRVLPPGTYSWKAATHAPFSVKYLLSVENSGKPGYHTPDGKGAWGGDWGVPVDVTFAGDKALLCWSGCEAGPGIIMTDVDGNKQWGGRYAALFVATDGELVFAYLHQEKQIRAYAVSDGMQKNFTRGELWAEHNAGKDTHCTGMLYANGKLYVADAAANKLFVYDARKGTILATLDVPDVHGMAALDANTLAVVSGGAVHKMSTATGTLTPWIRDHLSAPAMLALGPDGTLYVSNQGTLMNVSVFHKDGRYLRSIGKAGGRARTVDYIGKENASNGRAGKWDSTTMLNPTGLAVDPKGRLWVMEADFQPKRVSVWDPQRGKLLFDKFGPAYVSTPVTMDPADPTRVYCNNVEWKVDLNKGTWAPNAVMLEAKKDSPYFWPHMVLNIVFTAKNGKQYMHARPPFGQFLYIRRGDHFEGCAGVFGPSMTLSWRPPAKDWQEAQKMGNLLWEDINGDGVIQKEETRATKMTASMPHSCFEADLTMYGGSMYNTLYWQRIAPKTILKNGVPLYDDTTFFQVDYAKGPSTYTSDITVNPADGSVLMYAGSDIKYLDQTDVWPITYWTKDGKRQWRFRNGCRWYDMYAFPIARPDQLWGCTKNIGIVDGITGYSSYFGFVHMMTTDGLVLGTLMQDGRSGAPSGADRINCEWFTGQLLKLKDGRWLLLGGDQDGRVLQVMGLETIAQSQGTYTITAADSKAAADALADFAASKARAQSLVVNRTFAEPDWINFKGVTVVMDDTRSFTVKTSYDTRNLYLHADVKATNGLINGIQENQFIFKGGNCLDLQLATDAAADPKRTTPAPGDIRVLITVRGGKPLAVVYRPKVAGFTGTPTVFTSPTGKESFDAIEVWNDVNVKVEKSATGYTAVVTLPLERLGWTSKPGSTVKMDVGYLFGNETGNLVLARKYWTNSSFSSGVTNDVPNESRLEPAHWGTATIE